MPSPGPPAGGFVDRAMAPGPACRPCGMAGMYPGMGMMPNDPNAPKLVTLTRTDFLIQFVWQPPKPEERLKGEELKTKVAEVTKQMRDAQKNSTEVVIREADLEKVSKAASDEVANALNKAAAHRRPAPPRRPRRHRLAPRRPRLRRRPRPSEPSDRGQARALSRWAEASPSAG